MITTLDHISGGRAVLGIGAAWFETEHTAFGLEFGTAPPERLRWLGEALPIMRGMLDGDRADGSRAALPRRTAAQRPAAGPARTCRILVGGSGEKVTLQLVARYADAYNVGGTARRTCKRKEAILRQHCEAIGRDEREIERTAGIGVGRSSATRAPRRSASTTAIFEHNGKADAWEDQPVGTPEDVVEMLAPYVELGYRHLIVGFPSPYDEESMTRFAQEVRPRLAAG